MPASGRYELWAEGRGHVTVSLDGHPVLEAEGDPLRATRPDRPRPGGGRASR